MNKHLKTAAKHSFRVIIATFAVIGLVLTGGYFAVKFGWTNAEGIIDDRFITNPNPSTSSGQATDSAWPTYNYDAQNRPIIASSSPWRTSPEWQVLKEATVKDKLLINQVASLTGVSPRLLVAQLIVEQLRLFTSEREVYKAIFAPLKILGNQSQFSWGVVGLKEETARQIENNLKAAPMVNGRAGTTSPFYLGARYEHLLDFNTTNINEERFNRVTARDHYYAYLYAALYLKQIEKQWERAGFPISNRPEILSTLYNIGFTHSKPSSAPQAGGAEIDIAGTKYSFGGLAYEFYWSDELLKEFPR